MNINKTESITVTENISVLLITGYSIQLDAVTNPSLTTSTSLTFLHITTGPNRILFVGCFGNTSDTLTGITYNGVSLTFINKRQLTGDRYIYLYYLIAPATGANNVVISFSGSTAIKAFAVSYTGARQSGQPDISTTNLVSSQTSITTTLTTVTGNSWTILLAKGPSASAPDAGVGSNRLATGNDLSIYDSNSSINPPGVTSMTATALTPVNLVSIMAAFAPYALEINVSDGIVVSDSALYSFQQIYDSIKVYIDSVDKTDSVVLTSINISDQLTSKVNTASFKTFSETTSDFKPTSGSTVIIYDIYGNKIFGGIIANIEEKRFGITPGTSSELLEYTCSCQDFTKLLTKKLVVETYENMTCLAIITDIISRYYSMEGFTLTNVATGPTIEQIAFAYKAGDKCLDELAKSAGYDWYVDYDKDIHFFDAATMTSSWSFTDSTTNWTNLVIKPDRSQLRNRIYVRGGIYYSDPFTQEIEADGTAQAWLLAYTPNTADFSISISSATRTVGLKDIDNQDDFDFMLNRKEKAISMGNSAWAQANSPLSSGTIIEVTYDYEIPVLTVQEDSASITALAALEGGDGAYEYMIIDKNITSIPAARDRANAELLDYANPITQGNLTSYETYGVKSGQVITINSTRRGINADYLLTTVRLNVITPTQIRYTLDFTGKLYGFVDVLLSLFKRTQDVIVGTDEVLDALNTYRDATTQVSEATPILTLSAPPFKWSNAGGTTPNKMRWNLFQWA